MMLPRVVGAGADPPLPLRFMYFCSYQFIYAFVYFLLHLMNKVSNCKCYPSLPSRSLCLQDQQCSLLYVQHTPSICQFLGLSVPPLHDNPDGSNSGISRPETPTASTTPTPAAGNNNNSATVTTEGPAAGAAGAGGEAAHLANVPSPRGSVGSKCSLASSVSIII